MLQYHFIALKLTVALLPAALLWLYVWRKDKQPEPVSKLLKAVLLGIVICIPVALIELGIGVLLFGVDGEPHTLFGTAAESFIMAALPEESFKLLALWLVLRKNPYCDEHYDGIVYAVCIGLGFAALENVLYVFGNDDWLTVGITRALLTVPGHYAFAVLMGYYYSVYHFVNHSRKVAACIFLVPFVAHGIFDTLALSGAVDVYVGGVCFFILILFCVRMHKFAQKKVVALVEKDRIQNQVI